jgi:hypothetical protein
MRIWIDLTAPAHPVVFRPLLARLRARGHEVLVTARDYAQTLDLCRLHGIEPTVVGSHGGASMANKAGSLVSRTARLRTLLRVDAALCATTGLLAAAAPATVADLLGPDVGLTVVRVVGLALLAYALDLAITSRAAGRWQRPAALAAGIGNVVWEVATFVLVALGAFSVGGAALALGVAAVVGGLGLLQLRAARR